MARLLILMTFLVALAAAVALVPVGGRTVLARWHAARGPGDFVERGWDEARAALLGTPEKQPRAAQRPKPAHPARPRSGTGAAERPAEHHTAADRAALDRLVEEHAK
jgi:hypothetical protein